MFSTHFKSVNLSNADLSGRDLKNFDLTGANLTGANLTGANLTSANLTSANLTGANLTNANATRAILTGVVGAIKRLCCNNHCSTGKNKQEVLVICGGELRGVCSAHARCDGTSTCSNHNYKSG